MALRNILQDGDVTLKKKARPITEYNNRLHTLLDDLTDTVIDAGGLGLAAPQIGVLRRVCVVIDEYLVDETDEVEFEVIEMVNPRILSSKGEVTRYEGCLSFPGLHGSITRPQMVVVEAEDRLGNTFTLEAQDMLARACCHEINHLDGITIAENADSLYTEDQLEQMVGNDEAKE